MSSPFLDIVVNMNPERTPVATDSSRAPVAQLPVALTAKGSRTRDRIVVAAAALVHERGIAGTTVEDVRAAAQVSGSQMYHYFTDKNSLIRAVIDYQTARILDGQKRADLSTADGVRTWRDQILAHVASVNGVGGCPIGSLSGQLCESDPPARERLAAGFAQWQQMLTENLQRMQTEGSLPLAIAPADLAVTLLAALQGGLLLAQVERDIAPLETALNTVLALTMPSAAA